MMDSVVATHLSTILERTARVGILGWGTGLPLAIELARAGFKTTGIDAGRVASINAARHASPTSGDDVARSNGALQATTGFGVIADLDTIRVCVPTPFRKTKNPTCRAWSGPPSRSRSTCTRHADCHRIDDISGATEEIVLGMLEATRIGRGLTLAFAPERIEAGNPLAICATFRK
jgi:UDP-N-acetyl-D-glucosamine dehydrogenase